MEHNHMGYMEYEMVMISVKIEDVPGLALDPAVLLRSSQPWIHWEEILYLLETYV